MHQQFKEVFHNNQFYPGGTVCRIRLLTDSDLIAADSAGQGKIEEMKIVFYF